MLLNAGFTSGYHVFRVSTDRRREVVTYLFQAGSAAKAAALQKGFWNQTSHSAPFEVPGVPGALSDAKVTLNASSGRTVATAEVSFVVGNLVAEITVRRRGTDDEARPTPDSALAASLAKQQRDRLASTTR